MNYDRFFPFMCWWCFKHLVGLYLSISTCFILEVLYKSLNKFLKLMNVLECVVSLFSAVSFV